jgi:hypothetical protein
MSPGSDPVAIRVLVETPPKVPPAEGRGKVDAKWLAQGLLSLSSAVVVAVIGARINAKVEATKAALEQSKIDLDLRRFEADELERKHKQISEIIPRLVGTDVQERRRGLALLFGLYPEEAESLLKRVAQSLDEHGPDSGAARDLGKAADSAPKLRGELGAWVVFVGSDTSLAAAAWEVKRAGKAGFGPAAVYKLGKAYATTIGSYASSSQAQSAVYAARASLRADAYAGNLKFLCPDPKQEAGYFDGRKQSAP